MKHSTYKLQGLKRSIQNTEEKIAEILQKTAETRESYGGSVSPNALEWQESRDQRIVRRILIPKCPGVARVQRPENRTEDPYPQMPWSGKSPEARESYGGSLSPNALEWQESR